MILSLSNQLLQFVGLTFLIYKIASWALGPAKSSSSPIPLSWTVADFFQGILHLLPCLMPYVAWGRLCGSLESYPSFYSVKFFGQLRCSTLALVTIGGEISGLNACSVGIPSARRPDFLPWFEISYFTHWDLSGDADSCR